MKAAVKDRMNFWLVKGQFLYLPSIVQTKIQQQLLLSLKTERRKLNLMNLTIDTTTTASNKQLSHSLASCISFWGNVTNDIIKLSKESPSIQSYLQIKHLFRCCCAFSRSNLSFRVYLLVSYLS